MTSPAVLYVFRWLVRDTFRQARASALFWLLLGASGIIILACLSVSVTGATQLHHEADLTEFLPRESGVDRETANRSGVDLVTGELSLGFGLYRVELGRDTEDAVRFIQLLLAGGIADTAGILFALLWTAGFVPTFLEPASVSVLLAKPVPRWLLLAGKFTGVLAFVAFQASVFIFGTWLALGVRTGVWHPLYLACLPVLLLHFALFFSFSALVGVFTRSALLSMLISVVFWFACWGVNFGHLAALARSAPAPGPVASDASPHVTSVIHSHAEPPPRDGVVSTAGYWLLPKPADMNYFLQELVQSASFFARAPAVAALRPDAINPVATFASSLLFIAIMLGLAGRRLRVADY
jgi:ABC-type transport system involved in multi-copper enzyme maturation permease subunit